MDTGVGHCFIASWELLIFHLVIFYKIIHDKSVSQRSCYAVQSILCVLAVVYFVVIARIAVPHPSTGCWPLVYSMSSHAPADNCSLAAVPLWPVHRKLWCVNLHQSLALLMTTGFAVCMRSVPVRGGGISDFLFYS